MSLIGDLIVNPCLNHRCLILVKHSLPEIIPNLPAAQWRLAEEGRRRCVALADRLAAYRPGAIVASLEPKAEETARIAAERLGLAHTTLPGLHEHDRANVGWSSTQDFESAVECFFARPAELVFGRETADQARERFVAAVDALVAAHPVGNLVVVAHGTVISLLVAARASVDPLALWRRLGLPSFVVLALPDMAIVEVVEQVAD